MPNDPEQQLEALKRGLCGDCGVGPFRPGQRGTPVSTRAAWWIGLGLLLLVAVGAVLLLTLR